MWFLLALKSLGMFLLALLNVLSNIVVFIIAVPQLKILWAKLKLWFYLKFIYIKEDKSWDELASSDANCIKYSSPEITPYVPYIPLKIALNKALKILKHKYKELKSDDAFASKIQKRINKDVKDVPELEYERFSDILSMKEFERLSKIFLFCKNDNFKTTVENACLENRRYIFETIDGTMYFRLDSMKEQIDTLKHIKKRLKL